MDPDVDIHAQKALLSGLAEMAGDMARDCHVRFKAAGSDNEAKDKAIAAFDICGRNVRLSILAEVRLFTAVSTAVFKSVANDHRQRVRTEADRDRDRYLDRERESDRDRERDGFPLTAMGRAQALEKVIVRNPELDSDGRYSAKIIDIKARLSGDALEPEPSPPAFHPPPINRAERRRQGRRQRRASG